ncbi:MerR family transcriptional regulator [Kribbella sp. NPDC049174]|uniref:MerR family transcriptional regulator n=1 Tax=Kribbella sp. NPDC049174 TaxID=3364112 RepID=UPI003714BCBF
MRDAGGVITIGQLARYVGVSTKTIRVYHAKGLLPEPDRDASGYRRYSAQDAIELIKIRTLAQAGVPLADIPKLRAAPREEFQAAIARIDADLTARIDAMRSTRDSLRDLASGHNRLLPDEVEDHLQQLAVLGFTPRWVAMERDLWILTFATHPEEAYELFTDQAQAQADPALRRLYLEYDRAHDFDPQDPALADLAGRIVQASIERYGTGELPGQTVDPDLPQLIQGSVNASSPAWKRLDTLIRAQLEQAIHRG